MIERLNRKYKLLAAALSLSAIALLGFQAEAQAKLKVTSTYPYITDLVHQVAGSAVDQQTLATGDWDPHFIVAKPSLITRLRQADLLVINGAQLEIGWLPPLLRQSSNANIQAGSTGLLDLSQFVNKIQIPQNVSRASGDVHPQGNPHFVLDPTNVPKMAAAIQQKLCALDAPQCKAYQLNLKRFNQRWAQSSTNWQRRMSALKGTPVIEYHRLHDYFLHHYGLRLITTLEPLPGIPPTPQHLAKVIAEVKQNKVKFNLRGAFNPQAPTDFVSSKTAAKTVTLPHDVGAVPEAKDIFGLYESLLKRMGV